MNTIEYPFFLIKFCHLETSFLGITGNSYYQPLSWILRIKVALGAAKGLEFLHSDEAKVIYRDFKTSNILLDSVSKTACKFYHAKSSKREHRLLSVYLWQSILGGTQEFVTIVHSFLWTFLL